MQLQTPQQLPPQQPAPEPLNPNLMLEDPAEWQRRFAHGLAQNQAAQLAQVAMPVLSQQAETAAWMSRQDPKRKDIWEKYGHEVDALVAQTPVHMRTKALYDKAVDLVKGEHADEIAEAKIAERLAAMRETSTVGAGDGYGGSPAGTAGASAVWDKVGTSEYGRYMLEQVGKSGIAEHCRREGIKLEQFAEQISRSRTRVPNAGEPGVFRTELVQD